MTEKKAHEVEAWLARKDQSVPFILLYGPDRGLVSERAANYAKATGLPLDDPFSVFRVEATDLEQDASRLESELHTVAMFADRRLIWIRGLQNQRSVTDALVASLDDLSPDVTVLVEAGDLKKGAGLRAAVEKSKAAMALPCYADDSLALDKLIDTELEAMGVSIQLDARQYLKTLLGGDRKASRSEITKLGLYCSERKRIEISDVQLLVGDVAGTNPDAVVDAVLSGNLVAADQEFTRMEMAGTAIFPVLSSLLRQFHHLQLLRNAMETSGKSASAAVAGARPPIFFKRRAIVEGALQRWDLAGIARILSRLQATILETRRKPHLATALTRQFLLAVAREATPRRTLG